LIDPVEPAKGYRLPIETTGASASVRREGDDLGVLLDFLLRERHFDFGGYKRTSLARRIERRVHAVKVSSFSNYVDYLKAHPGEFRRLFNAILISSTGFFRDAPAWDILLRTVVPERLAAKAPGDPIRVWSAGCATGEEAYTWAMVLAEVLGREQFRRRVRIYGTDIDQEALTHARVASYDARRMLDVPPDYVTKYFHPRGSQFVFDPQLRSAVVLGPHDLLRDAPMSRMDFVSCRNTLMYFNSEKQAKVLLDLHFALSEGGVLFTGKAEVVLAHAAQFESIDVKRRLSRKVSTQGHADPDPKSPGESTLVPEASVSIASVASVAFASRGHVRALHASAFDSAPLPMVVVDGAGLLIMANERAQAMFGIGPSVIGRPLRELELAGDPTALHALVNQSYTEHRSITIKDRRRTAPIGTFFDVHVLPLGDSGGSPLGVAIGFVDVTSHHSSEKELREARGNLERARDELLSTREELERTNADLRSMAQELAAASEEVSRRTDGAPASTPNGPRSGIVLVDQGRMVRVWNRRVDVFRGPPSDRAIAEVLSGLDLGLPIEVLTPIVRVSLDGQTDSAEIVLAPTERRGRIRCAVVTAPGDGPSQGHVVLVSIEEEPGGR
jgi:two-component system, chemotaxis family, CheB/CheR fusion protein